MSHISFFFFFCTKSSNSGAHVTLTAHFNSDWLHFTCSVARHGQWLLYKTVQVSTIATQLLGCFIDTYYIESVLKLSYYLGFNLQQVGFNMKDRVLVGGAVEFY